ncbi:hypothetical protein ACFQJ5_10110 [Halomicroarcula sp. GCM10025324]|uniref:hypothetical protein n=1 Tax=Haloarcula TaxID=2237 RepID=UPI0023E78FC5|nr:hypothetical protein [Halomicroarcula sp. ZS-22-S1]
MAAVQSRLDPNEILRDVPADRPRYEDGWDDTYKSKFEDVLEDLDNETLDVIREILEIDEDTDNLQSAILTNESESILLYTLYRFLSDKRTLLREIADRWGDEVEEDREYRYLVQALLDGRSDIVYRLLLYKEWSDAKNERSYKIENELPDDYVDRFDDNFRSIQLTLARRTNTDHFRYEERNELDFEDSTIFAIDRQTSDRERRDVVGAQRRRNLRSVFVEVEEEDHAVHILTNNQTIRDTLVEKLEEIFSISLVSQDEVGDQIEVNADQFEEALRELPEEDGEEEGDIRILNVEFRRTQTTPTVPLTVSKKSYDTEIRNVVSELAEDIVNPEITNVRRFWFNAYGVDARVKVDIYSEENTLRLDTDIKTDSGSLAERIRETFQESFGLPLDQEIPLHWVTGDREQVISFILKNPPTYETQNNHYQDLIEDLDEIGVINTRTVERKQCRGRNCEEIYEGHDGDTCPACGGTLDVFAEFEKVSLSNRGILEFFKDRLEDEDIEYLGTKQEQIYRKKYRFRRVRHDGDIAHVLINTPDVSITPNTVNHLNKSVNPVTLLNLGTVKDQRLMEEVLAAYLDLSTIIDEYLSDELSSDYISQKIDQVTRATEERVAGNAAHAYDRLQEIVANPSEYGGEDFEPEIFHLINQIITNAEQWGTKRRGNLPDGFAELLFSTGQGKYFRSFGWDCKFTSSDEFHIGASEAKDLRDYVHRIKESTEVKSSDTRFKNFVVITNAESGNFGSSVADRINKMTSWDGTPVLMHVDFIFALHLVFNENVDLIKRNIQEFYRQFYLTLNDGKYYHQEVDDDFYVDLTAENAEILFENFGSEIEDSSLDISSLRDFMEQDIFP